MRMRAILIQVPPVAGRWAGPPVAGEPPGDRNRGNRALPLRLPLLVLVLGTRGRNWGNRAGWVALPGPFKLSV